MEKTAQEFFHETVNNIKNFYRAPTPALWTGRNDGFLRERFFQCVACVDLTQDKISDLENHFAIVGFASDEGVMRNLGRPGAKEGPSGIRAALAKLACHLRTPVFYDVGDIVCDQHDLEKAQMHLGELIHALLAQGIKPIVIGGGHEVAWGHYQGIEKVVKGARIGVVNFDAHLDLRASSSPGVSTSGTSFLQIAQHRQTQGLPFDYCCIGVQPLANTKTLFETAQQWNSTICYADQCQQRMPSVKKIVQNFIEAHEKIYVSVCMDVFAQTIAPGVSAPQSLGLYPTHVIPLLRLLANSQKVVSIDVAEVAPPLDENQKTVTLAASLIADYMHASQN